MAKAHVNPVMLRWAVDRAGVPVSKLGKALEKGPESITAWIEGTEAPTFVQAQKLAKQLRVPFGYLFLEEPPEEELPIPDFRRPHSTGHPVSIDLRDVISDVLRKQDWYRDHRIDSDEDPFGFVGRFSLASPVATVAADMGASLDFDTKVRPAPQPTDFLRQFVSRIEALGVLVMRNGVVGHSTNRPLSIEEFRGFSIADPMAPVIFVNNVDSFTAQIFTLAHELAHIWIGQGGISDADPAIEAEATDIESFCNEVAGELLLPWGSIEKKWQPHSTTPEEFIRIIAREFHVSTVMVARQLWTQGAIERKTFFDLYETERAKWTSKDGGSTGGNFYRTALVRNSRLLTEALLESVHASETSIRDGSSLLGVKPKNLPKLRDLIGAS